MPKSTPFFLLDVVDDLVQLQLVYFLIELPVSMHEHFHTADRVCYNL